MRMWMVDPKILCIDHLKGEHVELHMFLGIIKKNYSITGFIENNLIEPLYMKNRHTELVKEMLSRNWDHVSNLDFDDDIFNYLPEEYITHKINKKDAFDELISRCPICKNRYEYLKSLEKYDFLNKIDSMISLILPPDKEYVEGQLTFRVLKNRS